MARAGLAKEQLGTGGSQFRFNGRGEIVDAKVIAAKDAGGNMKCQAAITIQGLDGDWNQTEADPITEHLSIGGLTFERDGETFDLFHPGKSAGPDDDPEDLGTDEGTEGNAIWIPDVEDEADLIKVNEKTKMAIFSQSLQQHGFPAEKLNGYLPHLIGVKANFYQMPTEKIEGTTYKRDPTCLAVKDKLTFAKDGGKGKAAGKTAAAPAAGKAAAPAGKKTTAAAAPKEDPASTVGAEDAERVINAVKADLQKDEPVATTKSAIKAKLVMKFAKLKIGPPAQKAVQNLLTSEGWWTDNAEKLGFEVDGDDVVFPAKE